MVIICTAMDRRTISSKTHRCCHYKNHFNHSFFFFAVLGQLQFNYTVESTIHFSVYSYTVLMLLHFMFQNSLFFFVLLSFFLSSFSLSLWFCLGFFCVFIFMLFGFPQNLIFGLKSYLEVIVVSCFCFCFCFQFR